MRSLLLVSAIIAITACSDNQQSTSPVNGVAARTPSASQLSQEPQSNGKPAPGAVAFTKLTNNYGPSVTVPAGSVKSASVQCPAGSLPTGGGYDIATNGGTWPMVSSSAPNATGWVVSIDNSQAGSAVVYVAAWVICAS